MPALNTLGIAHRFIQEHLSPGGFCIDATAIIETFPHCKGRTGSCKKTFFPV